MEVKEDSSHMTTNPVDVVETVEKDPNDSEVVCIVDEKDDLKLFCYKTCSESDSDDIKSQRSVVKDVQGNVVVTSLPYTDEYIVDIDSNIPDIDINDYVVFPSVEGTLIRVFHHDDSWHITTNRKLDAFKSYWSSHFSFGQLFVNNIFSVYKENNIESFYHRLDTTKVYFFLLRPTTESRIVCNVDVNKPPLYFVGTLRKGETESLLDMSNECLKEIPQMEPLNLKSVEEICQHVRDMNVWDYQGIILFHKTKNQQIKFIHSEYKKLWSVRNNNPNLFLRYFEIRQDPNMLETFFKVYPKFIVIADKFEAQIFEVSKYLHQAYVDRYIRKQYVSLPKQEYVVLKKAHDWHNQDRNFNRMYRHKMLHLINQEKPIHLYQIVKRHFKY